MKIQSCNKCFNICYSYTLYIITIEYDKQKIKCIIIVKSVENVGIA